MTSEVSLIHLECYIGIIPVKFEPNQKMIKMPLDDKVILTSDASKYKADKIIVYMKLLFQI